MKRYLFALWGVFSVFLVGCTDPLPPERFDYAGEWRSENMSLLITESGRVEYERKNRDGSSVFLNGPIQSFTGDNFTVGLLGFETTFVVSERPHKEGNQWRMTVDGEQLIAVRKIVTSDTR